MGTTQIDVRYVNAPAEGKRMGSIKTTGGDLFFVDPAQLGLFQPGHSYSIEFSEREWQGKTYRTVTSITNGSGATVSVSPAPRPRTFPARETSPAEAERIFTAGIVNASIAAGKCEPQSAASIMAIVAAARAAWRGTFGGGV
jgi:hypothetical protein